MKVKGTLLFILMVAAVKCLVAQTPTITTVVPNTVSICGGDEGTLLTINGSNFQSQGSNSEVKIGSVTCIIYSWTNTRIYCYPGASIVTYSGTVTVTNNSNNSTSHIMTKFVYPTPDPLIDAIATLPTITCGDSTTLIASASNGNTEWYSDYCGGTLVGKGITLKVAPFNTTTYYARNVSFIPTGGCASSCRTVTVTVTGACSAPVINAIPANACAGSIITISGSGFTGVTSVTINGVDAPAFTVNSDNSISITVPAGATTGPVSVTNSGGTGTSAGSVTIGGSAPLITLQPLSQVVCVGKPALFSVTASGSPLPTYQWRKSGVDISNATDSLYTINAVTPADTGSFAVVATNTCGNAVSQVATLQVNHLPAIDVQPVPQAVCAGKPATMHVEAAGATAYQWKREGLAIGNANDSVLAISAATAVDSGRYYVVLTNACGADSSQTALLNVKPVPLASIVATDTGLCSGDSLLMCLQSTAGSYAWSNGDTGSCTYAHTSGTYQASVTHSGCVSVSGPVTIVSHAAPAALITAQADTLTASSALTYQWKLNGTDISGAVTQTHIARQSGSYSVEITDTNGCKAISPGFNYVITSTGGLNDKAGFILYPNPVANVLQIQAGNMLTGETCQLLSITGQVLTVAVIQNGTCRINVASFAPGIYLVRVGKEVSRFSKL